MTEESGLSFEEKFDLLENIVSDLEGNDLSMEQTIDKYQEGLKLYKSIKEDLEKYKGQIKIIRDGKEEPFEEDRGE